MAAALIELRALDRHDADALHEFRVRNRAFLGPWEPLRDERYYTLRAARETIQAHELDRGDDRGYFFGVFADRLVGFVNLSGVVRGAFANAYLGYAIDEECNGHGFATAAVREATRTGFEELGLHRVQAAVLPRNGGSLRVLAKAGFREEGLAKRYLRINGVWEDHLLFARTVED